MPEFSSGADVQPGTRDTVGPGRVLVLGYGFFSLAAGARSTVQLCLHPHQAVLAYIFSAVAAVIYLSTTILLAVADRGRHDRIRRVLPTLCLVEVAGVLAVGTTSLLIPSWFPDATVWSSFGSGHGWVPLALPLLALWWLRRSPSPQS